MSEYKKTTPALSGEFHTVDSAGTQEIWDIRGSDDNGGYLAVQHRDGQEYSRRFAKSPDGWVCVDDPDGFTGIIRKLPSPSIPYIPQVGHRVLVDFEDLGLHVAEVAEVAPTGTWFVLFRGEPGEQQVGIDDDGNWFCRESGQRVYVLDPQARPELDSIGFVIPTEGPVEEWFMNAPRESDGGAEGFLHAEQASGMAYALKDGTWQMNDTDPIFFISAKQAAHRTGGLRADTEEASEAAPEPVSPMKLLGKGPHVGEATSRVVNGVSLLYRVCRVDTDEFGNSYVTLTLLPDVPGHVRYEVASRNASTGECTWFTGEKITFTSGKNDDMALAATRLTTLRQFLRNKYFHYAAMGRPASSTTANTVAMAIRDEYMEQLFLVETGLLPVQAGYDRFDNFCEALNEEFMASQEN